MENLLKNELFTHVSTEELEKMIPCFEMTKRSFREKDIIPTHEGEKNYICLLLSGTVSVNRISIDGSLDLLEYLEDTGGVCLCQSGGCVSDHLRKGLHSAVYRKAPYFQAVSECLSAPYAGGGKYAAADGE